MNRSAGPPVSGGAVLSTARPRPAFQLSLAGFEGPIDLLLRLSERDELDITTVSLVQVTTQYLTYFRSEPKRDVPAFADFVAIAARLLLLKSRSLLPRPLLATEAEEPNDVDDLDAAVREYVLYRGAAADFGQRTHAALQLFPRVATLPEAPTAPLKKIAPDELMAAMVSVLSRLDDGAMAIDLPTIAVTVAERVQAILGDVTRSGHASFFALAGRCRSRLEVLVTFLAILHLVRDGRLMAEQAETFGEILLRAPLSQPESV